MFSLPKKLPGDDAILDTPHMRLQSQVKKPSVKLVHHSHCTSAELEIQATIFYRRPFYINGCYRRQWPCRYHRHLRIPVQLHHNSYKLSLVWTTITSGCNDSSSSNPWAGLRDGYVGGDLRLPCLSGTPKVKDSSLSGPHEKDTADRESRSEQAVVDTVIERKTAVVWRDLPHEGYLLETG